MGMDISTDSFTNAELLNALCSLERETWYEFTVADTNDNTVGTISFEDAKISFDSTRDVMRQLTGSVKKSDIVNIDLVDQRIIPWMCFEYKGVDVKWPLGRFLINPSANYENDAEMIEVTGYDKGKIIMDDKTDSAEYVAGGTIYTSKIAQICGQYYDNMDIEATTKTISTDKEWDIGTSELDIVNELLSGINYNPLHFDEKGTGICDLYCQPSERSIERAYSTKINSVILDDISLETNAFEIPNKWVRYTESADDEYYISTYINDDSSDPYSTVSRGRTIADVESVDDIASQADLDAYVKRIAQESMSKTETLTFNTLNMPGHGYSNCLFVDIELYGIEGKYIETEWEMNLTSDGVMSHKCQRAVAV